MQHLRDWPRSVSAMVVVVVTLAMVGCGPPRASSGSSDNDDNDDENGGEELAFENDLPDNPEGLCKAACQRVYTVRDDGGCQQSFQHDDGSTMNEAGCVDACLNDDLLRGGQRCIAASEECKSDPEELIDECLPDDYHPPACEHLGAWEMEVIEKENEVLELVNELRSERQTCPATGTEHSASEPLEMNEELRCAARLHSLDMVENDFFAHYNPDGQGPAERAQQAGYESNQVSENIAAGNSDAEATVNQWFNSDEDHCRNMLNPSHEVMGVGMVEVDSSDGPTECVDFCWTQKFGDE